MVQAEVVIDLTENVILIPPETKGNFHYIMISLFVLYSFRVDPNVNSLLLAVLSVYGFYTYVLAKLVWYKL